MSLSVIIPSYNEALCIAKTIESVYTYFRSHEPVLLEVVVVDDCSVDNTGEIVLDLKRQFSTLRYIRNEQNRGKGFSVRQGVLAARGEMVLFMDADSSTGIDQFAVLWQKIHQADIVIGSRAVTGAVITRHQPLWKELVARAGNVLIRLILGLPFHDTQCGFKLFTRKGTSVFRFQTIERWGFDMELLYIAKKRCLFVQEVPICWTNDPTSLVKISDYAVTLADVARILTNECRGRYTSQN